jgi:hypothetical protein
MLPAEPPPVIMLGVAWLLIGMFVVALAAAIIVKVPETVRCPFVLTPKGSGSHSGALPSVVGEVRVVRRRRSPQARVVRASVG